MARCLHRFYARRSLPTQLFCGFLASLSTAHCYLHDSTFQSICCDGAPDCELPEATTVGGHKVQSQSSSRSLPSSGVTSTQPMVRSNRDDMTKDSTRDSPKFSNLLHAASHSSGEQDSKDTWLSENPSTSETDYDDERDVEDEDAAGEDPFNPNSADNVCRSPGCQNAARSRGRCPTHGGGTRCNIQGCMKHVVSGGLCVGHGGGRQCRGSPRCTSSAVSRGLCVQHGGGRKCSEQGCNKHVASGGLCRTHGGGRRCQIPNCTSSAQSRGLCYVHGGGGRCQRVGCGSSAKKGGLCIAHGGGHRCQVAGCASSAVSGARCRAHGGGRRCAVDGCTSSAKTGGRCIAHGGGKRCTVSGCTSSAQRLGLCKAHGGGRRCVVENCANSAVSRGRCIAHGGGKRCVFKGCTTTARKGGFCFAHGGRSNTSTANSKSKTISHPSSFPTTPVTVSSKALSWSTAEVRSPIPALTLPPRRLLPPINTMLMANRPSILRRYPYTQIPPIRKPVVSIERGTRRAQNVLDEEWRETSKPTELPTYQYSQYQAPQTSTSSLSRTGYSWQRLQETIRRESRAHGITNDKDESAYEDTDTCKAEESETPTDGVEVTGSRLKRTKR